MRLQDTCSDDQLHRLIVIFAHPRLRGWGRELSVSPLQSSVSCLTPPSWLDCRRKSPARMGVSSRTRLLWSAVSPQMLYSLRLSNRSQIVAKMNHLQYSTVPIAIGYQVLLCTRYPYCTGGGAGPGPPGILFTAVYRGHAASTVPGTRVPGYSGTRVA